MLNYLGTNIRERFSKSCLEQHKITSTQGKILSIYIAYEIASSTKIDNKKKHILILGKGPTQWLEHKKYSLLFLLKIIKNPVWACVIMQRTVIYLLMVDKVINLKQRILKL